MNYCRPKTSLVNGPDVVVLATGGRAHTSLDIGPGENHHHGILEQVMTARTKSADCKNKINREMF